jgi:hypothetical protein
MRCRSSSDCIGPRGRRPNGAPTHGTRGRPHVADSTHKSDRAGLGILRQHPRTRGCPRQDAVGAAARRERTLCRHAICGRSVRHAPRQIR